jgi:lysyl-tRNA synthetase class 2
MADRRQAPPEKTLERIIGERREKGAQLRERGHHPYRNDVAPRASIASVRARYESTKPEVANEEITPVDGELVQVAGRAMSKRGFGKTVFLPIRDGSGADIQIYVNVEHLDAKDFEDVLPNLDAGDQVCAEGPAFWTKRGELSILARRLWVVTKSLRPLPD